MKNTGPAFIEAALVVFSDVLCAYHSKEGHVAISLEWHDQDVVMTNIKVVMFVASNPFV